MPLSPEQKIMAERLAELLGQSTLDDSTKENIIENLDKLPEEDIAKLIRALEAENDQIDKIAADMEAYLAAEETGGEQIEKEEKNFVAQFTEKMAQALDNQAQIEELKESL